MDKNDYNVRPANSNDFKAITSLLNKSWGAVTGNYNENTLEDIKKELTMPKFDINLSTQIVETLKGKIIGFAKVLTFENLPVHPYIGINVDPEFQNKGIGTMLLEWAQNRAGEFIDEVPEDMRVSLMSGAKKDYKPAEALLKKSGFSPIRYFFEMETELNEFYEGSELPGNIKICTFKDRPILEDVCKADTEIFKEHWGYIESDPKEKLEFWQHFFIDANKDFVPELWYIAMVGDDIAGICLNDSSFLNMQNNGYVNILGVKKKWRKQGLGKALLIHSFNEFYKIGKNKVSLHVDASSLTGATRLYESVGMHPAKTFVRFEKEIRPGKELSVQSI